MTGRGHGIRTLGLLAGFLTWTQLTGCSANFGEHIDVPQRLAGVDSAPTRSLRAQRFPGDRAFEIFTSHRTATNTASAKASARPEGAASCEVSAGQSGAATAEFQLGTIVTNDRTTAIDAEVSFDCAYTYVLDAGGDPPRYPEVMGLKLFIQDDREAVLQRTMILDPAESTAIGGGRGRVTPSFNVQFEPQRSYRLVLAGKVELLDDPNERPLVAGIEVSEFTIAVALKPTATTAGQ